MKRASQTRKIVHTSWAVALLLGLTLTADGTVGAVELPAFTPLVKAHSDAVVNIGTTRERERGQGPAMPGLPEGSPFEEFFERFFRGRPGGGPPPKTNSLGSGFIISEDGYVLTNAHVVEGAESIVIRTSDHREYAAEIAGSDQRSDVALLKIDAKELPTVELGDSSELEVGEWVLAIGSPFGLEYTATQGIVSALGRSLPSDAYVPFIQTDVAVNPGNSGGPLFNTEGEVVGINAQIVSRTGGYMGVSFAIPINVAMQVAEQLRTQGYVSRGWLGVTIQPVNQDLAESFGLERPYGALVSQVMPDSPADRAGLAPGDVIIRYDGETVEESGDLPVMVGGTEVGEDVTVTVVRGGETIDLGVTIGQLPSEKAELAATAPEAKEARLNVAVRDLSPQERQRLGVEHGVLVEEVRPGPAARAGIRRGDVILAIGGEDIESGEKLASVVATLPTNKPVPVLVKRGEGNLFVAVRIPARAG